MQLRYYSLHHCRLEVKHHVTAEDYVDGISVVDKRGIAVLDQIQIAELPIVGLFVRFPQPGVESAASTPTYSTPLAESSNGRHCL